jgi:hypothetical protein
MVIIFILYCMNVYTMQFSDVYQYGEKRNCAVISIRYKNRSIKRADVPNPCQSKYYSTIIFFSFYLVGCRRNQIGELVRRLCDLNWPSSSFRSVHWNRPSYRLFFIKEKNTSQTSYHLYFKISCGSLKFQFLC